MTSKEKTAFRRTKLWKDFRKLIIQERKHCQFCGSKYRMNLHHKDRDPNNYTVLKAEKFLLLCNSCHKYWELKASIKNKSNFNEYLLKLLELFHD